MLFQTVHINSAHKIMISSLSVFISQQHSVAALQILCQTDRIKVYDLLEHLRTVQKGIERDGRTSRDVMMRCFDCMSLLILFGSPEDTPRPTQITQSYVTKPSRRSPAFHAPSYGQIAESSVALTPPQQSAWYDFWSWLQELKDIENRSIGQEDSPFGDMAAEVLRRSLRRADED